MAYEREINFLGILKDDYNYIARDSNGRLYIYEFKPTLDVGRGYYVVEKGKFQCLSFINDTLFPNVLYSDGRAKSIEVLLEFYHSFI